MRICPQCKEQMPALSKICPVCGYIETQQNPQTDRLEETVLKLEKNLEQLKKIPQQSFLSGMGIYAMIIYLVLAIQFFVLAAVSLHILAWGFVLLFLLLFIVSLVKRIKGKSKRTLRRQQLEHILAEYETEKRQTMAYYGKNREIKELIGSIEQELDKIKQLQKKVQTRNYILGGIATVLILVISGSLIFSISKHIATADLPLEESSITEYLQAGNYEKAIQIYPSVLSSCLDEGENCRSQIIQSLVSAKQWQSATDFFYSYSMGNAGDFKCAKTIVTGLLNEGQRDEAATFVEDCTGLRYASDLNKLKKLIYK